MKHQFKTTVTAATLIFTLTGCGTVAEQRKEIEKLQAKHKPAIDNPMQLAEPVSRVREIRGAMMPITHLTAAHKGEWLKAHKVQLDIKTPTPMAAVVQKLTEQGINITSDLPLDTYFYAGKINSTDAETALQVVFGSVGLDYQVNDSRKLIIIKPLASRTWYLNIGNRKSSYSSDGNAQANNSNSGTNTGGTGAFANANSSSTGALQGQQGGMLTGGTGATGSGQNSASPNSNSSASNNNGSTGTGVASADDFWKSLSNELGNRMTVLIPRSLATAQPQSGLPVPMGLPGSTSMMPPLPQQGIGMPAAASNTGADLYVKRLVGSYALNPETGAVTVQAPHWMLNEFETYITRIQEMYNTDITFTGELVLVTNKNNNSEGFDLGAFATWAGGRYAAVISNNALGGITMTLPNGGSAPSINVDAQPVAGPVVGIRGQSANNALSIFNSYLAEQGKVSVIQRPLITTTSGVPGVFSKKFNDYYNTVSQTAASGGTGSAATATQNELVAVELGTELKLNPRIDIATGLIRAQLTLNQSIQSGVKNIPQTITFGNNTTTVSTAIPLITRQYLAGEILLRDGDLIVVGGQTENNSNIDESGIPGANGPLGGFLGVKKAERGSQTYYFALRVTVTKRK